MLKSIFLLLFFVWILKNVVYLQCVFHGIRFKVRKIGSRETSFFIFRGVGYSNK